MKYPIRVCSGISRATQTSVILALSILMPSCGRGDEAAAAGSGGQGGNPSPIVLTTPPRSSDFGRLGTSHFGKGSTPSSVAIGTGAYGTNYELTVGGTVTACRAVKVLGVKYLLVGHVDSNNIFTLTRFHDVTSDDGPDASTAATVLTSSPTQMYTSKIAISGNRWFFLDRRCQDIWVADSTAGFPTSLKATPFATALAHPSLLSARFMVAKSSSLVDAHQLRPPQGEGNSVSTSLADTNSDDVADSVSVTAPASVIAPNFVPYDGMTELKVGVTNTGVVQVWKLDSLGAESVLLGSASVTLGTLVPVSLSPALAEGDSIRIRLAAESHGLDYDVIDDYPQLSGYVVAVVTEGVGATVTLSGVNLTSSMLLKMTNIGRSSVAIPMTLTFSVNSSNEVVAAIPALSADWIGRARLSATVTGQARPYCMPIVTVVASP